MKLHNMFSSWVLSCLLAVIVLVGVGGFTRLTHSGLSITEWNVLTGVIPPMSHDKWQKEWNKYKQSPEYKVYEFVDTVEEFKRIYMTEYAHRLVARLCGLLLIIPGICFLLSKGLCKRLKILIILSSLTIGCQGLLGWLMVQSGLENTLYATVSSYKLAMHTSAAILLVYLLVDMYSLNYMLHRTKENIVIKKSRYPINILLLLAITQLICGSLGVGSKAFLLYNDTFPLMSYKVIPDGLLSMNPIWKNFLYNAVTLQFLHRTFAMLVLINTIYCSLMLYSEKLKTYSITLLCIVTLQFILGVLTLFTESSSVLLPVLHQLTGFIFFAFIVFCNRVAAFHNQHQSARSPNYTIA